MAYSSSWKQRAILAVCLILPFPLLHAQPIQDLQILVKAANAYWPSLKEKLANVNSAKAVITDVHHSFLPQLRAAEQLNLGTDNSLAGSYYSLGITPSTSAGVRAENDYQAASGNFAIISADYELINFGLNDARVKTAQAFLGLQQAGLAREEYLLTQQVAGIYFQLLRQQYRLNADQQNVERNQAIFIIIQALTASGIQPGADSSQAKAELSKARIIYNQTFGKIGQLKDQLSILTGIPAANLHVDTLASSRISTLSGIPDYSMDTMHHPLIDYFSKQSDIFRSTDKLIRKSYLPKISLGASAWARGSSIQFPDDYKSLSTGLGYQRFNYFTGLALTYNLFNGLYRKDKLAINRYQMEASDWALEQEKLLLQSSVFQADQSLQTIQANLVELSIQSESALATYQQKLAQYRAGIITLIDLSNASFVLYRSQTDFIETLHEWWLAQLEKAAATGNLNLFIQSVK